MQTSSLPAASTPAARLGFGRFAARLLRDEMLQKSLLSIVDQAVVSATNFAITVVLGRLCGKPEVGLYYLALQVVFFARGVQEQVICAPYLVYAGRKQGRDAALYGGSSLIHLCGLIVASMIAMAVAASLGITSPELSSILWLLVGVMPLMLLREFARQRAFAELSVTEALVFDVTVSLMQLALLAAAAYYGVLDTWLTYVILGVGCGAAMIAWIVRRRGTFQIDRRRVLSDWRHNWQFARWALATQLLGSSMPFVIPWIVAAMHGESATGTLGVGTTLIGFANMFVLGLSNFVCPRAARAYASGGSKELLGVLQQAAVMHLSVLVPMTITLFLAGDQLMGLIYGAAFADAGGILAILSIGALVNSLGIVAGNGLWAMERPAANFRSDVCALVAWILATWFLVGPYGATGAAIASVTGTVIGACVRLFTLAINLREPSEVAT